MSKMIIESSTEDLLGFPSGFDDEDVLTEGDAEKIKAVISKLQRVKTKGDIDSIIKALKAIVI